VILDRLYRLGLWLLPRTYDARDREEMWQTYLERVARASARPRRTAATGERLSELFDLGLALLRARAQPAPVDALRLDLRGAARSLMRTPLTSLLAIGSLTLGIGATSSIFSALDVWLVRPLPLPNHERLVAVSMANRSMGWMNNVLSIRDYADWQAASRTVDLMAYATGSYNLSIDGRAERVRALQVSANATGVLGIEPTLGRGFVETEGTPAGDRVALLTDSFWRTSLGADPDVIGRSVLLDGIGFTVIGVLPSGQRIPGTRVDVWTPLRISGQEERSGHFLHAAGLVQDGYDIDAVREELAAVAAAVAEQDPDRTFPDALVRPFREEIYGPEYRQGGIVLAGAALFVLLIACANIANLLVARGMARTHELAVRGTLGASRSRIVQQLLVESSLIALVGGLLGVAIAYVGIDLLLTYALPAEYVTGWDQIALDRRTLIGASILTVLSVMVFGLLPAVRTARLSMSRQLAATGREGTLEGGNRLAPALVVGEIAATLALVTLSALLIRSLTAMQRVDLEMRTSNALVFRMDVPRDARSSMEEVEAFYQELAARLMAIPGIDDAASSSGHIVSGWSTYLYSIDHTPEDGEVMRRSAEHRRVTTTYLDVMGLRMVAGRWFDVDVDRSDAPPVAVVSRALAAQWWEDPSDALGRAVHYGDEQRLIVGVVDPGRLRGAAELPPPAIFVPFAQAPTRSTFNVVAHGLSDLEVTTHVRRVVEAMDPTLAVFDAQTIEDAISEALGPQTSGFRILGSLGALALVLTLVGVYGVMAHSVGGRMREMGIRMALGADGWSLVRMCVLGTYKLYGLGIALGIVLSLIAGQAIAFMLPGVSPRDPATLAFVSGAVCLTVLAASYLPARKAALADPVRTMRTE
jgi:putative ABC transport system permease protein